LLLYAVIACPMIQLVAESRQAWIVVFIIRDIMLQLLIRVLEEIDVTRFRREVGFVCIDFCEATWQFATRLMRSVSQRQKYPVTSRLTGVEMPLKWGEWGHQTSTEVQILSASYRKMLSCFTIFSLLKVSGPSFGSIIRSIFLMMEKQESCHLVTI